MSSSTLSTIEQRLTIPNKRKRSKSSSSDEGTLIIPSKRNRNASLPPSKEELVSRILAFVEKHSAIRQNTPEWYNLFSTTVGGSEISVLYDMNKYMKRNELLEKKRNPSNLFVQPVACLWGKLFESIIRLYIKVIFDTQIYGHDICIIDGQFRYSPDGLGVYKDRIVLFEFKCPYIRRPNGDVPKQYIPQLWAGLVATGEIASYGIYVDAVFRKCSSNQLGNKPGYDKRYHSRDFSKYKDPVAWGLMNVYAKDGHDGEKCIDFGNADDIVFDKMLKDVDDGVLMTSLVFLAFSNGKPDVLVVQNAPDSMHLMGYIPFKIMQVCCKKVEPIPNFKPRRKARIDDFFTDVNKN